MSGDNRSVNIGGNAIGNVIVTGDENQVVKMNTSKAAAELKALAAILCALDTPEKDQIAASLGAAEQGLNKPEPNKPMITGLLEQALDSAKKAADFGDNIDKISGHVTNLATWAGAAGAPLLALIGAG